MECGLRKEKGDMKNWNIRITEKIKAIFLGAITEQKEKNEAVEE